MKLFNPNDKQHANIVLEAIRSADSFGIGRISNAKEQLEMNDIRVLNMKALMDLVLKLNTLIAEGRVSL